MLSARVISLIAAYILERIRQEFIDQGHNLTGETVRSLEHKVTQTTEGVVLSFFGIDYAEYTNRATPAGAIPYTIGGPRRGGTSKYIQGLIRYVERRMGLRGKDGVSVAFAIARKHKREGRPTRASFRYSKNGRRTGWIDQVIENNPESSAYIESLVQSEFEILIQNFVSEKKAA